MNSIKSSTRFLGLVFCTLVLVSCGSRSGMGELEQFVQETLNRLPSAIEPLPEFIYYEPFTYSAANLRSPFDSPLDASMALQRRQASAVKPDESRPKEFLESFSLASLRMVGSLSRGDVEWVLVQDGENGVHRVTVGNYMGRNHGVVTSTSETQIDLTEIVPSGNGGWVERPQTIILENLE